MYIASKRVYNPRNTIKARIMPLTWVDVNSTPFRVQNVIHHFVFTTATAGFSSTATAIVVTVV